MRRVLRETILKLFQKAFEKDEGRRAASETLRSMLNWRPTDVDASCFSERPYGDIASVEPSVPTAHRDDIVFVTARFRSGSTLLWNLFRNVPDCTAYYEPFNERRWFDPAHRGGTVDTTHRAVEDYWKEFDGLAELSSFYDENWSERDFYMAADAWNPSMKRFIEIMVERASGQPVLQFNHLDFRLPWVRETFPRAKIVHLYRHPRDQWTSVLQKNDRFPPDGRMSDFAEADRFYTRRWARDLKYHFPFLDERSIEHPYELHYFLWKLSYGYGRSHGDISLSFEELTTQPERSLVTLFDVCGVSLDHVGELLPLVQPPPFGKWVQYASDDWFRRHEQRCEGVLAEFFSHDRERTGSTVAPVEAVL